MLDHTQAALWCAHPRLKDGEAFSSWLHRFAFANGLADHTFCRYVFGSRPVWNRDVDHLVDSSMIDAASKATGERADRLRAATLHRYEGTLYEQLGQAYTPWVLSLGVYHRLRKRHGQQFCSECLRESEPWMRLDWRLAWVTCCLKHGLVLHDACPRCETPMVFHRSAVDITGHLRCHCCGADLVRRNSPTASAHMTRFQAWLELAMKQNVVEIGDQTVATQDLFSGLRVLARGVYDWSRLRGLESAFSAPATMRTQRNIEQWRLPNRIFAMHLLAASMQNWPADFVRRCRKSRVLRARFETKSLDTERSPDWMRTALEALMR